MNWKVRDNEIIETGSGAVIAQVNVSWPDGDIQKHLNLICAAPEMYEALVELERRYIANKDTDCEFIVSTLAGNKVKQCWDKVKEAIQKAEVKDGSKS